MPQFKTILLPVISAACYQAHNLPRAALSRHGGMFRWGIRTARTGTGSSESRISLRRVQARDRNGHFLTIANRSAPTRWPPSSFPCRSFPCHFPPSFGSSIRGISEIRGKTLVRKTLAISHLQTTPLQQPRFRPKKGAVLQKIRGPAEIILHFFLPFSSFLGLFPSQAIAFQPQPPLRPLPKKSCQKTYHRFFARSAMWLNGLVKTGVISRNEGCAGRAAVRCPPALHAQRFGARNDSSAFVPPAGKRRWRARTPRPAGLSSVPSVLSRQEFNSVAHSQALPKAKKPH